MADKFEEREKSKLQIGSIQKKGADKSVSKWQVAAYVLRALRASVCVCLSVKPLTRLRLPPTHPTPPFARLLAWAPLVPLLLRSCNMKQ